MPSLAASLLASLCAPAARRPAAKRTVEECLQAAFDAEAPCQAIEAPGRGKYVSTSVKDRARWSKELCELKESGHKLGFS